MGKIIEIEVPENYRLPEIYCNSSEDENKLVFDFGELLITKFRSFNVAEEIEFLREEMKFKINEMETIRREFRENASEESKLIINEMNKNFIKFQELLETNIDYVGKKEEFEKLERRFASVDEFFSKLNSVSKTVGYSRQAVSTLNGQENENFSHRLILDTFCELGSGFEFEEKKHFSGDHIFSWHGIKIMWEDKNYTDVVPKKEIDKALSDFENHQECDILIFVSAKSLIKGKESPTNIKIEPIGKKLVIFISEFRKTVDPYQFIKFVLQPIIYSYIPILKIQSDDDQKLSVIGKVLVGLSLNFLEQEQEFNKLLSNIKSMKINIAGIKNSILDLIDFAKKGSQ